MGDVVVAVIAEVGRVLLAQRPRSAKSFPFSWESPGGKVEPGESHAAALQREVREELGVDVEVSGSVLHRCRVLEYDLYFYEVQLRGLPVPQEGQGLGWFDEDELGRATLTPGNRAALGAVVGALRRSRAPSTAEVSQWLRRRTAGREQEDRDRADAEGITVCDWCYQPFAGPPGVTTSGSPCYSPHMHDRAQRAPVTFELTEPSSLPRGKPLRGGS